MLCSSFSLSNVEQLARNVNARAQLRRVFGRVVALFSDIHIYLYSKREKERERKKLDVDDVCLGERETSFGCRREKREKRSSFYKTQDKKGGDNRIFFQEGRCGYLGLFFFSFFKLLSLCCVYCVLT